MMQVPYYEPTTVEEEEVNDTVSEIEYAMEQDAKAGYVTRTELACTEREDNPYFGFAQSTVFLRIWNDDLRGWVPTQSDLKSGWQDCMTGSETDFDVAMPDGSTVRVTGSAQKMEALAEGKVLSVLCFGSN